MIGNPEAIKEIIFDLGWDHSLISSIICQLILFSSTYKETSKLSNY